MYWAIYISVLLLLVIFENKTEKGILALLAYFIGLYGAILGFTSLPEIYTYMDGVAYKQFAPAPWFIRSIDGVKLCPRLNTTYIINPSREPLVIGQVLYSDHVALIGNPVQGYNARKDTVTDAVLSFPKYNVAAFEEAPNVLEVFAIRGVQIVNVVAFPQEELASLNEEYYRRLEEVENDYDTGFEIY